MSSLLACSHLWQPVGGVRLPFVLGVLRPTRTTSSSQRASTTYLDGCRHQACLALLVFSSFAETCWMSDSVRYCNSSKHWWWQNTLRAPSPYGFGGCLNRRCVED